MSAPLLEVEGLRVQFGSSGGALTVVDDVGFSVEAGKTLGLVGESGCGKTVTALAVMGLLPPKASRVQARRLRFDGRDLTALSRAERRQLRGDAMAMVFQEPMTSLNPAYTVGNQIAETVQAHRSSDRRSAWKRAVEVLELVGIPDAAGRARDYPHAFSGGMRQRVMIAMALANEPRILIADEPTTALDVTVQAEILDLMRSLQQELGMAMVFVTHDLGVVADICHDVAVLYAGQVVEHAGVDHLFSAPAHPYTAGLLASMPQATPAGRPLAIIPGEVPRPEDQPPACRFAPRCPHVQARCEAALVPLYRAGAASSRCVRVGELPLRGVVSTVDDRSPRQRPSPLDLPHRAPLLEVRGLSKSFPVQRGVLRRTVGRVQAVDGIDLDIGAGETLGLVGESGSGKSTVARLILRLVEPSAGSVRLNGQPIHSLAAAPLRQARRQMQIVFQDPYSSLDPRATVGATVAEPLLVHEDLSSAEREERVIELLGRVGLGRHCLDRYPHEFSGGQRQRIAVARALALEPQLVVCDEPVSSLDVSTQSQVINLLMRLQRELGLSYLFIAHDLSVVRHISDRIAVMYLGRIVEVGDAEEVYLRPTHPYTQALLSAIPLPDPGAQRRRRRTVLRGDPPSPLQPPPGCRFHTRCPHVMDICRTADPVAVTTPGGSTVACHLATADAIPAGAAVEAQSSG